MKSKNTELENISSGQIQQDKKLFSIIFEIAMFWRIFYGAMKTILGFILLQNKSIDLQNTFLKIMEHEIIEDPNDILVKLMQPTIEHISSGTIIFIAVYLIFWGLMEIFISINILRHKLWAFTTAFIFIGAFILYKIYKEYRLLKDPLKIK